MDIPSYLELKGICQKIILLILHENISFGYSSDIVWCKINPSSANHHFQRKWDLNFHVNHLLGRWFTWNIKSYFLWKISRLLRTCISAQLWPYLECWVWQLNKVAFLKTIRKRSNNICFHGWIRRKNKQCEIMYHLVCLLSKDWDQPAHLCKSAQSLRCPEETQILGYPKKVPSKDSNQPAHISDSTCSHVATHISQ